MPNVFPPDAEAIIYRPAPSPMTSGRYTKRPWRLEFRPRSAPWIEPLTGWTGSTDPLTQLALTFPSCEAAIAYAQRQELSLAGDVSQAGSCVVRPQLAWPDDEASIAA
jgi:hypothetical protein